jgi:hypothetical protein
MSEVIPENFLATKWYADIIDPATGNLIICYWAEVKWKKWNLGYTGQLQSWAGKVSARSLFRDGPPPLYAQGFFGIKTSLLQGDWLAQAPPMSEMLLENAQGYVRWECVQPCAQAELVMKDLNRHYQGVGYVERITFSVLPWEMPITILHWGRFLADGHVIVWIRWEGREPRNLLFHNGQPYPEAHIDENQLRFGEYTLDLAQKRVLRAGTLMATVFKRFAWLKTIFPEGILNLKECKWQTRANLTLGAQPVASAWVIHEKVEWV